MFKCFAAALSGIALMSPMSATQAREGPSCAAGSGALPAEFAGWSSRSAMMAAKDFSGLPAAAVGIGTAVDAALTPTGDVRYVAAPEKAGGLASYGGLFSFTVESTGTYRVALGSAAWIDVLKGEAAVASTAHGHGPDCSGIRKVVDFPLAAGSYTLQIAGSAAPSLPLMIVLSPGSSTPD